MRQFIVTTMILVSFFTGTAFSETLVVGYDINYNSGWGGGYYIQNNPQEALLAYAAHDPGELESESKSWLGQLTQAFSNYFKKAIDGAVSIIRGLIDAIDKTIHEFWTNLKSYLTWFWENVQRLFFDLYTMLGDAWAWSRDAVANFCAWLGDVVLDFWNNSCDVVMMVWNGFVELLYWIGETLLEWFVQFMDWLVLIPYNIFLWLLDQLPQFMLPPGFSDGLRVFREFGGLLDSILPMHELFFLICVYFAFLTYFTITRWILRLAKII